jgi:hypothetical protein
MLAEAEAAAMQDRPMADREVWEVAAAEVATLNRVFQAQVVVVDVLVTIIQPAAVVATAL